MLDTTYKKVFWSILVSLFMFTEAKAQELLIGLSENVLHKTTSRPVAKSVPSLDLPFVDDFSKQNQIVPDTKLWTNSKSVFVNRTYAINPPTVGVATFDAFDHQGKIYKHASSAVFSADTLTSAPIDLMYLPQDSIYFSFYIQPQGYGDMPESNDSLSLMFYSVGENKWHNMWKASVISRTELVSYNHIMASTDTLRSDSLGMKFFRVDINISDSKYLQDEFRFQFVNYASISVNPNFPGRSTSSDHWHLDYVYLDKNRTILNKNLPDIALVEDSPRLTKAYESVPATHFEFADDLFDNPMSLNLKYQNLGWGIKSVTRNFRIRSLYGTGATRSYSAGAENVEDGQTIDLSYAVPKYDFTVNDDSASFEVLSWIVTDTDITDFRTSLRHNDTSTTIYEFRDYYAYDDGTAENGYGLYGNGAANGQVAVKFQTYMADSLRGVYMYFNRAVGDVNENHKFILAIWDDAGGTPGSIIHKEEGGKPVFNDSLNQFVAYKLSKPVNLSKGDIFYLGWLQTDDGFLNIGFDRNRNNGNKTYYNLGQNWEQSVFEGSLMLRPIFCRASDFPSNHEELEVIQGLSAGSSFITYPNPASSVMYLKEQDNTSVISSKIEIFATSGELVKVFENVQGNIDLTTVRAGLYLMRVWDKDKKIREVKKIIIAE